MEDSPQDSVPPPPRRRFHKTRRTAWYLTLLIAAYAGAAYLVLPLVWEAYLHEHPSFDENPRLTETKDGHPGDPINVSLIGDVDQVKAILNAAQWRPAAALGLRSDLEIAEGTLLSRPDETAPVSNLYLFGRKEDLAYEKPVGDNPRQRHHVRFWDTKQLDNDGRPIWMGSAAYDKGVGFSHTTGQITHHIGADVDAERDFLFHDLEQTKMLQDHYAVDGFHKVLKGRNGGGDPWHTDGRLFVGVIKTDDE